MRQFLSYLLFVSVILPLAIGDSVVAAPPQSQGKGTKKISPPSKIRSTPSRSQRRTVKTPQRTTNKTPVNRNYFKHGKLPPIERYNPGGGKGDRHSGDRFTPRPPQKLCSYWITRN